MPRWLTGLIFLTIALGPSLVAAETLHGASLPRELTPVSENRFRSQLDLRRTIRFFRRVYGQSDGVFIQNIRGDPRVDGVHVRNIRPGRQWDAVNVYEAKGTVHVVVLPHLPETE